jgi:hypothetical protein
MNRYIDGIAPFLEKIIQLTESKQMKWEKSGNNAYRCVDVKDSLSIEISGGNGFVGSNITFKLYSADKLEYEYTPGFMVKYPDFEALLSKLYSLVEEEDLKRITSKLSKIMSAFSKGENE